MGLLRIMALVSLVIFGGVACGSQEQGVAEPEVRTVTQTVTETVAAPENEPESTEAAESPTEQGPPEEAVDEQDSPEQAAPEDTLALQYQYINSGEYEQAYELFAPQSKQIVSLDQYRAFFEASAPYTVDDYSFPSVDVQGDTATVNLTVTISSATVDGYLGQATQELVLTDEGWRAVMRDGQVDSFTSSDQPTPQQPDIQEQPNDTANEPETANAIVRVTGNEAFSGNYGTLDSSRSVDGIAPAEYSLEVDTGLFSTDSVTAVMQKTGAGSGELGVEIIVDGEVVQETSTTAEYGVAQVSWIPGE